MRSGGLKVSLLADELAPEIPDVMPYQSIERLATGMHPTTITR